MEESGARCRSRMNERSHEEIPPSPEWRCFRCTVISPTPDGTGRPPIACLESLGGCGREISCGHEYSLTSEWAGSESSTGAPPVSGCACCEKGETKFFPAEWSEIKIQLYIDADLNEGSRLFRDVVREIEKYFIFQEPFHSRIIALLIFETYFARPLLPCVYYLGVGGPPSAGKTTLLEIIKDLCWNGKMSGDFSVSASSKILDAGCPVLADEADQMDERTRDLIYGSARRGYRRGSTRIISEAVGRKWVPMEIAIFGVYVFSFYNDADVEPALLSRMMKIDAVRFRMDARLKEKVYANMVRTLIGQSGTKERVEAFVKSVVERWPLQRVANRILDLDFQRRVHRA